MPYFGDFMARYANFGRLAKHKNNRSDLKEKQLICSKSYTRMRHTQVALSIWTANLEGTRRKEELNLRALRFDETGKVEAPP